MQHETWTSQAQRARPAPEHLGPKLERALKDSQGDDLYVQYARIRKVVVAEVGPWAYGWCWGSIDGGPVRRWCCTQHSFLQGKPDEEPARTVDLILAGLEDWSKALDDAEALFNTLVVKEPIDLDIAVLELVQHAVDATDASDAWYGYCVDILSWYLQHLGISANRAGQLARRATNGHFESWVSPSQETMEQIAESFRELVWKSLGRR